MMPAASRSLQLNSLRAFYFCNFGAIGALFPFLPLLLAARGLDGVEIAWVMVLTPLCNLLVPPLWGAVADTWHVRLWLLRATAVGGAAAVLLLLPAHDLWHIALAIGLMSFFRAPTTSLVDATVYHASGGGHAAFSQVRVWGSIGFGIFALLLGWLQRELLPMLLIGVTGALFLASAAATAPLAAAARQREPRVVALALQILRRPAVLLFLAGTALYYFGHSTYDVYFGLHAQKLGLSNAFIGSAWALGVGVEVAVMLLAPRFIERVSSRRLLVACAAVAATRWGLLAWTAVPWAVLAIQSLHGVTYGLWYLSLVKHVQDIAGERLRSTLQSVATAALGLGQVGGYLVGGQIFEHLGGAALYRGAALAALGALLCYAASALSTGAQRK
ncbi:MAG: MFS transporter [Deltaproteobacteria bacterium]|nr:MFS transporter [Deltaproteobacteria bacterium]